VRRLVGAVAALYLAAHLALLPPALEDLDSVNFALGIRDFDVAQHQPHPPGYPAFIAAGKLSAATLGQLGAASPDVRGLAALSAVGGALSLVCLFGFFRGLPRRARELDAEPGEPALPAVIAAILVGCCPLVWFNSARPMSDMAGLAVAFSAFYFLIRALGEEGGGRAATAGALLAALSVGFRSQMALLTGPLLLLVLLLRRRHALAMIAAGAAGVLIWAVPLIVLSGGLARYLASLGGQAGDDFTGVVMLWTNPSPRVAIEAALYTFVRPWGSPVLGGLIVGLAIGGLWITARRDRRAVGLLAIAFGPYAVFHLLFQEPLTIRYALPLIPVTAYLAATLIVSARRWTVLAATAALAVACLAVVLPASTAFAQQPSPFFALLDESRIIAARGAKPLVGMHRRVFTESRRARVYAGELPGSLVPSPRDYEWLEVTRVWREGYDGETWFVADPRRTDLALIDRAHARVREYRWPFDRRVYVGGTRPTDLDWHIFHEPGWFLERGWALTPEIAGISERDGWGPHKRPSVGWVRRRGADALMVIGGRHLGSTGVARIAVTLDQKPVATFAVSPGYFLEFVQIPASAFAGAGVNPRYAELNVAASGDGGEAPPVAIEQFNLQPAGAVQFGVDEGWYEPEYNPATARSWRWMSERATIRVHHADRPVTVRLTGEAPRHYFGEAPVVRVLAGERVIAEATPFEDFTIEATIPADALAAANGRVVITSSLAFVAGEREGTADRRRLALRIYHVEVGAGR